MRKKQIVLFALINKNKVLIEKRPLLGFKGVQYLIPGGAVEETELENIEIALRREMLEELGIIPIEFSLLDCKNIYNTLGIPLTPFIFSKWDGEIPTIVLDKDDQFPLEWVEIETVLNSPIHATKKIAKAIKKVVSGK